jgi:hypothetical protein
MPILKKDYGMCQSFIFISHPRCLYKPLQEGVCPISSLSLDSSGSVRMTRYLREWLQTEWYGAQGRYRDRTKLHLFPINGHPQLIDT